jgi:hypothetical protein
MLHAGALFLCTFPSQTIALMPRQSELMPDRQSRNKPLFLQQREPFYP